MSFPTGAGTPNHVIWDGNPIHLPASMFPRGTVQSNGTVQPVGASSIQSLENIASFPAWTGVVHPGTTWYDPPGTWHAKAWVDTAWGLSLSDLRFDETAPGGGAPRKHVLAAFLQWRNLRLIFEDPNASNEVSISMGPAQVQAISIFPKGGQRQSGDKKRFAWGINSTSIVKGLQDPRSIHGTYDVTFRHTYLVGAPALDQDPGAAVYAIKVFPTLTVTIQAMYDGRPLQTSDNWPYQHPSIGADLKMVHAPRLTRNWAAGEMYPNGQRRKDAHYVPLNVPVGTPVLKPKVAPAGDVFAYAVNDTNDEARPDPGDFQSSDQWLDWPIPGTGPQPPYWDVMFDYINPWIKRELAFDAVVHPRRPRATPRPMFKVFWPGSKNVLKCYREPGQGEYDNLHVSPYLGFDDPSHFDPSGAATEYPLVEAPLAGDEMIHLHWRWGPANPGRAEKEGLHPDAYKGWSDGPNSRPNTTPGAPMIPAHHSLRIKVARAWPPFDDNADNPPNQPAYLDTDRIAVWYSTIAHRPKLGTPTQFFGQGYSLGYYLRPATSWGLTIENWELLTNTGYPPLLSIRKPGYHDLRWKYSLTDPMQRVPGPSEIPEITRNMLTPNDPAKSKWKNGAWS